MTARRQRARGVAVLVAWVVVTAVVVVVLLRPERRGDDRVYVVPRGTAQRIAAGEQVDIIPLSVSLRRNDRVIVQNRDTADHLVGPFGVRAGETVTHRFSRVGRFAGVCSIHPDRTVTFVVR